MSINHRVRASIPMLSLALLGACASGAGAGAAASSSASDSGAPTGAAAAGADRYNITEAELTASGESAYDLINRLHPDFFRAYNVVKRGQGTGENEPAVVEGGQKIGSASDLRRMAAASLSHVRYYPLEQAKQRFGMQYLVPVIEITYRAR